VVAKAAASSCSIGIGTAKPVVTATEEQYKTATINWPPTSPCSISSSYQSIASSDSNSKRILT